MVIAPDWETSAWDDVEHYLNAVEY